jgi:hypothetical protein
MLLKNSINEGCDQEISRSSRAPRSFRVKDKENGKSIALPRGVKS